jgi:hypothetical protein
VVGVAFRIFCICCILDVNVYSCNGFFYFILRMTRILVGEIQIGEFFVVFFSGFVVGLCGLYFIFEITEGDCITIGGYFGDELLFAGIEAYAFVLGAGVFSFLGVAVVLGTACGAKVCPAIVEAVMVDVVNDMAGRDFYYTAMHINGGPYFSCGGVAFGVKGVAVFSNVPFVFAEPFVIIWVNEGKPALCQWYSAERTAVAEAAIEKEQANAWFHQPFRYVEGNSDFPPSGETTESRFMNNSPEGI